MYDPTREKRERPPPYTEIDQLSKDSNKNVSGSTSVTATPDKKMYTPSSAH